jgi:hypothetical protein
VLFLLKKGDNVKNAACASAHLFWNQENRAFFDAFWIDRSQKHGEKQADTAAAPRQLRPFFRKAGTMRERGAFSVRSV